ncbi:TOMM precursor leader peptide-binding protein [Vitiosangium sp. GDMCC 1.1324]|uniref:TOMM precursor leader peptide-binding protein n=1 Tax=Vitiosangium sp. (strain GDMCC 1.1324) TaxID=2138576 RepID=UPI000D34FADA|nr:TOMM precursor leader peptide-binding protein [Vitiosangium sp. GDMCC 1.1324]PTL81181.1 adenylate cyclase [Vitiosangium sp. GDMCC 1.1324]
MSNRPTLKSCYDAHVVDEHNVLLLAKDGADLLTGRAYANVIPLLDGTRTVDELLGSLAHRLPAAEIFYVLARLEDMGFIRTAPPATPPAVAAFWETLGVDADVGARRLRGARVAIHSLDPSAPQEILMSALSGLDIHAEQTAGEVAIAPERGLSVLLVDDYLNPKLEAYNRSFLASQAPFVLAKLHGPSAWLGPVFRPGHTGCWQCLAARLRQNRVIETYLERLHQRPIPRPYPHATVPPAAAAAAHLLSTEIVKWIALDGNCSLDGSLISLDFTTLATERHALVRRPQCIACGAGESWRARAPEPVRLRSQPKTFTQDGGYRACAPEVTLARHAHQVSPITGVIAKLHAASFAEPSIAPVYISGQNTAMMSDSLSLLRTNFRGQCSGKGKTDAQAKASALCEAIERHSGVFQGDEIRVRHSYRELGERAIHPNTCMCFSDSQYAARETWNAQQIKMNHVVPVPFDEHAVMEWCPLWSLTEETFKYLPASYCYYGYPEPSRSLPCLADSNGCAAGNCVEEAILQGFMELIERDSVSLWWYNRVRRPRVDLDSFDEPYFAELRSYYRSLGRDLWVLDLTTDLGIPAFAAISASTRARPQAITLGFGAHLSPRLGILRAITEANQFLPLVLERDREPSRARPAEDVVDAWLRDATLEDHDYLVPATELPPTRAADYSTWHRGDLRDDVDACVRVAAEHGLETLVLDQTRPDIGMHVVKVVVPGLRHFWRRLGPGRLYDVPVKLGWLQRPRREHEFNPVSIFF